MNYLKTSICTIFAQVFFLLKKKYFSKVFFFFSTDMEVIAFSSKSQLWKTWENHSLRILVGRHLDRCLFTKCLSHAPHTYRTTHQKPCLTSSSPCLFFFHASRHPQPTLFPRPCLVLSSLLSALAVSSLITRRPSEWEGCSRQAGRLKVMRLLVSLFRSEGKPELLRRTEVVWG